MLPPLFRGVYYSFFIFTNFLLISVYYSDRERGSGVTSHLIQTSDIDYHIRQYAWSRHTSRPDCEGNHSQRETESSRSVHLEATTSTYQYRDWRDFMYLVSPLICCTIESRTHKLPCLCCTLVILCLLHGSSIIPRLTIHSWCRENPEKLKNPFSLFRQLGARDWLFFV